MTSPSRPASPAPPRVLVVDDSAVVRQVLTAILSSAGMQVEVAGDPLIAMERMARQRPDAVVLDIEMPRMDGLTFLRRLMSADEPVPALICSSLAGPGTEVALQALDEGAVGIVEKPRLGVKGFLQDSARQLIEAVRGALHARVRTRAARPEPRHDAGAVLPPPAKAVRLATTTSKVVAVGASTGGTEALRELLMALPPDAPGIAIVQHMPEAFTGPFARRLHGLCRIEVKEAQQGDRLCSGRALVAPGNHHLAVRRSGAHYFAEVLEGPPVSRHRPSVDVLFRSTAQAAGANAVGVILTGMGDDGAQGLLELRQAGAHTIAQDEATSVVFGMPRMAIEAGAASEVLPLPAIAAAMLRRAS
ncbi:protein-glutamate methylesterase/protein-glutamine glutaminase [Anaeromyxobacter diazotrophicus]|uniref:Protein-glutamate methylesterase/protein-glutamine glutaminase n=1 Tax=Anaeromyxobacter diazotrophicus TaxID=2590199 RepID=A0A7I9VPS0_9BACT|nr:chemotaxis response regulator protein-glutamate methylesterase [Anaeromyxobacter diazotrophicus]GEJ58402.1 chemotaxis response regulator protein-glutamate methylesterase of group 2 operon [Anaeromyxobacter diazotrophicus]